MLRNHAFAGTTALRHTQDPLAHLDLSPVINRSLAACVAIWSIANPEKSTNMISITGRMPTSAAPVPAPTMEFSLMGVLMARFGPN